MSDEPGPAVYFFVLGALATAWWFEVWPFTPEKLYTSEVGYYSGDTIRYDYQHGHKGLEACRATAISIYRYYEQANRATEWSCLLENGKGGYLSRHR